MRGFYNVLSIVIHTIYSYVFQQISTSPRHDSSVGELKTMKREVPGSNPSRDEKYLFIYLFIYLWF